MPMANRLNRYWRVVATAGCFAVFGLGGLMVRCVAYPVLVLTVRDPQRRMHLCQNIIHHGFRWFVRLMTTVGVISYELHGQEKLSRRGLLVLANHPSLLDVVLLIAVVRHANCIVKEKLARNPFTGGPIHAAGFITNDDGATLLDACLSTLEAGNNLVIFPEGTRTPLEGPVRLQRGAAQVAFGATLTSRQCAFSPVYPCFLRENLGGRCLKGDLISRLKYWTTSTSGSFKRHPMTLWQRVT
jgi:1-acyl-sn-glycerol-3-phosphate acyltransferase